MQSKVETWLVLPGVMQSDRGCVARTLVQVLLLLLLVFQVVPDTVSLVTREHCIVEHAHQLLVYISLGTASTVIIVN